MTDATRWALDAITRTRRSLLAVADSVPRTAWREVPPGLSNNVLWNVGHVAVTAERLTYGLARLDLPGPAWAHDAFRKGTSPADWATPPDVDATVALLDGFAERVEGDARAGRFASFRDYTTTPGVTLTSLDEAVAFDLYHEGLHLGSVLALRKLVG